MSGDTPSARALRNKNCKPLCLYTSLNEQPSSCYTERVLVHTGSAVSMGPYEQPDSNDEQELTKPPSQPGQPAAWCPEGSTRAEQVAKNFLRIRSC